MTDLSNTKLEITNIGSILHIKMLIVKKGSNGLRSMIVVILKLTNDGSYHFINLDAMMVR